MGFNLNEDYHYIKHSTMYGYKTVKEGMFDNAVLTKKLDIKTVLNMFYYVKSDD